jgi:hypothetical protein
MRGRKPGVQCSGTLLQRETLLPRRRLEFTMDLTAHNAIAGRLEAGKVAGWLSEYLVAWHGAQGDLEPNVTVWRAPDQNDDRVKVYLNGLLAGLVPEGGIVIAES